MIHFEHIDIRQVRKIISDSSCIIGNFPMIIQETDTPETAMESVKELFDICMLSGRNIFDCDESIDIAKEENLDALFNVLVKYGNYT